MKTIKQISLTYALLLRIPLLSFGQTESKEVLSFEEAYRLMEENNPGLMRMKEQVKHVITSYSIHYTKLYDATAGIRTTGCRALLVTSLIPRAVFGCSFLGFP